MICDPVWQKAAYSLSDYVTAVGSRGLKVFPWNFHRLLYIVADLWCEKCTGIHCPEGKL